jgi:catechol 2,3-dioxygenase-like lactoylglutathione lyase family enzyme
MLVMVTNDESGRGAGSGRVQAQLRRREVPMLQHARVATRIPVRDLARARTFYAERLGLEPAEERPGGLLYRLAAGEFALFESAGAASGDHTQMAFDVDDIEAVIADLRRRGLEFEAFDMPGLEQRDGITEVPGNYPSKGGKGERGVWFRDCDGNLFGLGQAVR